MEFLDPVKGVGHPFQSILGLQPEELQNPTETQFIQNAIGKVTSFSGPSYFEYTVPDAVNRPGAVMVVRTSTPWVYLSAPINAGGDQTTNQINGSGWIDLAPYESFAFISDGSNWFTIFDSRPKAHLPAGGSDGDMLRKHTSNVYQSYWSPPPREGDILKLIHDEETVSASGNMTSFAFGRMHVLTVSGAQTITLPTPVGNARRVIGFRVLGTGFKTIQPKGSETIDGQTSKVMAQRESVALISDGVNWHTIHEGYSRAHMPPGGSSGQVLAKTSQADFEAGWVTPSGGGGGNSMFGSFKAHRTTDQALTAAAYTKVYFTTEEWDSQGWYNNGGSGTGGRFTPQAAGYYRFGGSVLVLSSVAGYYQTLIYKNGTPVQGVARMYVTGSSIFASSVGGGILLYANGTTDFFEVFVYTQGGTLKGSSSETFFQAEYVGP